MAIIGIILLIILVKVVGAIKEALREPQSLDVNKLFNDAVVKGKSKSELRRRYKKGDYFE